MASHDEHSLHECKRDFDPTDRAARLQLVKELVAMANADGGSIHIGVDGATGERPGVDEACRDALDPARVADLVDAFIAPDHLEVRVLSAGADRDGCSVVILEVEPFPTPPIVFTKQGTVGNGKDQRTVFGRHSVYRRKGTKAAPAERHDFRAWIEAAVMAERDRLLSRLALVASLPPDVELSVHTPSGELDEPAQLLDRATKTWQARPHKLLSKEELVYLLSHREATDPSELEYDLLIHSALRRRPTLGFWLVHSGADPARLLRILTQAIDGDDRDKSDAGRAIVDVACIYLSPHVYETVLSSLEHSKYAHFREAAAGGRPRDDVWERLKKATKLRVAQSQARDYSATEIDQLATLLARSLLNDYTLVGSRQLTALGTALMIKHAPAVP